MVSPRNQLSGPTDAVMHYNCLSRHIASMACRVLLFPKFGYFGDFGFFVSADDDRQALVDISGFFELFGLSLRKENSAIGQTNAFFGLNAFPHVPADRRALSLSPTYESARRWSLILLIIWR